MATVPNRWGLLLFAPLKRAIQRRFRGIFQIALRAGRRAGIALRLHGFRSPFEQPDLWKKLWIAFCEKSCNSTGFLLAKLQGFLVMGLSRLDSMDFRNSTARRATAGTDCRRGAR